jgi:hypothetical protein
MSPIGFFMLAVFIAVPILWLVAECRCGRALRIGLGMLAIATVTIGVSVPCLIVTRFNYNAWYGHATKSLIETSLEQLEGGRQEHVVKVWRGLNKLYEPTYENRAGYVDLVNEANQRLRDGKPIAPGSRWDAPLFSRSSWLGHWENDSGFWIVVSDGLRSFDIWRSGDPPKRLHSVSVSVDFKVLRFEEDDQWRHTLTFVNQYEAKHEWFDLQRKTVWRTESIYRLIQPKLPNVEPNVPGK